MKRTESLSIGRITVEERDGAIVRITMDDGEFSDSSPLLERCFRELREYLAGTRRSFDLPLSPRGTPFQLAVWEALRAIPYGEVRYYSEIAAEVGSPAAARAVGAACRLNPIPLIVPCHRVIGRSGVTGYTFGEGVTLKERLIRLEREGEAG